MKYISGIHALNLPCGLQTCGDWHTSSIQWDFPTLAESAGSILGDYGIEFGKKIPQHQERYAVANHIRALLDLIQNGQFELAQGMRKDYICNEAYTEELFEKVFSLRENGKWDEIDRFMHKEYGRRWRVWKNGRKSMAG